MYSNVNPELDISKLCVAPYRRDTSGIPTNPTILTSKTHLKSSGNGRCIPFPYLSSPTILEVSRLWWQIAEKIANALGVGNPRGARRELAAIERRSPLGRAIAATGSLRSRPTAWLTSPIGEQSDLSGGECGVLKHADRITSRPCVALRELNWRSQCSTGCAFERDEAAICR